MYYKNVLCKNFEEGNPIRLKDIKKTLSKVDFSNSYAAVYTTGNKDDTRLNFAIIPFNKWYRSAIMRSEDESTYMFEDYLDDARMEVYNWAQANNPGLDIFPQNPCVIIDLAAFNKYILKYDKMDFPSWFESCYGTHEEMLSYDLTISYPVPIELKLYVTKEILEEFPKLQEDIVTEAIANEGAILTIRPIKNTKCFTDAMKILYLAKGGTMPV